MRRKSAPARIANRAAEEPGGRELVTPTADELRAQTDAGPASNWERAVGPAGPSAAGTRPRLQQRFDSSGKGLLQHRDLELFQAPFRTGAWQHQLKERRSQGHDRDAVRTQHEIATE
jgi:hypothetical protein